MITSEERNVLRGLAERVADIASLPIMAERRVLQYSIYSKYSQRNFSITRHACDLLQDCKTKILFYTFPDSRVFPIDCLRVEMHPLNISQSRSYHERPDTPKLEQPFSAILTGYGSRSRKCPFLTP